MQTPGLAELDTALREQDDRVERQRVRLDLLEATVEALERQQPEDPKEPPAEPEDPPEQPEDPDDPELPPVEEPEQPEEPIDPEDPDDPEGPKEPIQAGPVPQFRTWDGITGPNREYWNAGAKLYWRNRDVGDWLDADGRKQGPKPFASVKIAKAGVYDWDVTAVVAKQLAAGENRGFFMQGADTAFSFTFHGRAAGDPAVRPRLRVVTSEGTFDCPPIATARWAISSYKHTNGSVSFAVQQGQTHAIVQFDYGAVTGQVQSAVMTLTMREFKRAGSVHVFEADPPAYVNGGYFDQWGIAAAYDRDKGIEQHPSVIFASDFTTMEGWGGATKDHNLVVDERTGLQMLRKKTPAKQYDVGTLSKTLMRAEREDGPPTTVVEELYARYYLTLEEDWNSTIDTNKTPGFDMRMGFWTASNYWQHVSGNGGVRGDGRLQPTKYGGKTRMAYHGHLQRGHSGVTPADANPFRDLAWLGAYMYHIDQAGFYGSTPRWGNVLIERGRAYCIEQHIKMNSLTGPEDEYGNREAVADGVYEVWVDGTLCYQRTNFRWKRHPQLGIVKWWMGMYHGGKVAAPHDMHCRWGHVVLATEYIGPIKL